MKLFNIFLGLTLLGGLASCSNGDSPKPEPPSPKAKEVRTILVYMVSNNSLGSAGFDNNDLAEMQEAAIAGFPDGCRLLIYWAGTNGQPVMMEMFPEGGKTLKTYATDILSVTSQRMKEVFADMKREAPAKKYGIIFWSHASGWLEDGIEQPQPQVQTYSFGIDGQTKNRMNISTLASTMEGEGFDFAYFDCCYMGGVEVAYELRHAVKTVVASAAEIPGNGSRYDLALPYLMQDEADCVAAAKQTFAYYQDHWDNPVPSANYDPDHSGCTLAVVSTAALDQLAQEVKKVYATGPKLPEGTSVQQFQQANRNYNLYYDLGDYLDKLQDGNGASIDVSRAKDALSRAVVYKAATPRINMQQIFQVEAYCGLSTFILRSSADITRYNYTNLDWYTDVASSLIEAWN